MPRVPTDQANPLPSVSPGQHLAIRCAERRAGVDTNLSLISRNDAVIPISSTYAGCNYDDDGLCSFDNVVSVLQQRIDQIDYDYDCFGNYTAKAGIDYNGRAPR